MILPISGVHRGTLAALRYAQMLSDDVTAVHVSHRPGRSREGAAQVGTLGRRRAARCLDSPYRLFLEPLLEYIEEIAATAPANEIITIVVPQFVPKRWWHNLLHTQTATWLRLALLFKPGIVITDVPYQVE